LAADVIETEVISDASIVIETEVISDASIVIETDVISGSNQQKVMGLRDN